MPKILNELRKEKQSRHTEFESEMKDVKGLLAADNSRDVEIYRQLGISGQIEKNLDKKGQIIQENILKEEWGEDLDIIHIDDIEKIAFKYNLRFLRTKFYKGTIDASIARKVEKYCTDHKIDIRSGQSENFYILAREEDFNLEDKPEPPRIPDPVMLYKIDKNNYQFVTHWGSDLNFLREFTSWYKINLNNALIHYGLIVSMVFYFAFTVTSYVLQFGMEYIAGGFNIYRLILSLILGFITATANVKSKNGNYTNAVWKSRYTRSDKTYDESDKNNGHRDSYSY